MLKKVAIAMGLMKAPRATLLMKYPKKGAKALLAMKGAKIVIRSPVATAVGAAVAVPVAVFTVRKFVS